MIEVPIHNVEIWLEKVFGQKPTDPFQFLSANLLKWAQEANARVTITPIPQWEEFESGLIDWGKEEFKAIIWDQDDFSAGSSIYFISDETLIDHIICLQEQREIRIIFHEGKRIMIVKKPEG